MYGLYRKLRPKLVALLAGTAFGEFLRCLKRRYLSIERARLERLIAKARGGVIAADVKDPASLMRLAGRMAQTGLHVEAIDVLRRCLTIDPHNIPALLTVVQIAAQLARYQEAFDAARQVLRIDPNSVAALESIEQILPGLGNAHEHSDVRNQLIEAYQAMLTVRPDDVSVWLRLGACLDARQRDMDTRRRVAAAQAAATGSSGSQLVMAPPAMPELEARKLAAMSTDEGGSSSRADVTEVEEENTAWARLITAQHNRLGFLDSNEHASHYGHTQFYLRNFGLYTQSFGVAPGPKPEQSIPSALRSRYSMNGSVPIEDGYLNAAYPAQFADLIYEDDLLGHAAAQLQALRELGLSRNAELAAAAEQKSKLFANTLAVRAYSAQHAERGYLAAAIRRHDLQGRRVASIAILGPWVEAMCLLVGATPTRISPTPVISHTTALACVSVADWERNPTVFDDVIAHSTIEHMGLGRLGEALDPDGDCAMMERVARMLAPGGRLFLFVPIGRDVVVFTAGRVYGRTRLPVLLDGWRAVDVFGFNETTLEGTGEGLALLVLQRS